MSLSSDIRIGVAGAGAMGMGIAQVAAMAGHAVTIWDANPTALQHNFQRLTEQLGQLEAKGKLAAGQAESLLARMTPSAHPEGFAGCKLVIEAIVEQLSIKQELFKSLEAICGPDAVLATNTSSLSIAGIGAACRNSQRVIGLHFFNPAPLMPLVEVIPAFFTNPELAQEALAWMRGWGKVPVLAKDTPGFIVNRIARPYYGEALRLYEEQVADFATIDEAMRSRGFKMGPFELMDFIGHDVNYRVTETVFEQFFYDPRYKPSITQKRLFEAGCYGRKTGQGYYRYADGLGQKPSPNTDSELQRNISERILVMLINEAAEALHLGIGTAIDLDLAMTKGVNYPKGLLAWADDIGIEQVLEKLSALYDEYGEDRYRPSVLLKRMAKSGKTFF
jgi:3-hydroxybutyryl-CoA dehydrogenase